MLILIPALFALLFTGVQGALMYQARELCLAAAQEGAREAASEAGDLGSGLANANDFLSRSPAGLSAVAVSGQRSALEASVTVSATSVSVVPGWNPRVTQSASMPVERLTG